MFALNGREVAVLALSACAVVAVFVTMRRGGDVRLGLAALLVACLVPVAGPLLAGVYVAVQARARRAAAGHAPGSPSRAAPAPWGESSPG